MTVTAVLVCTALAALLTAPLKHVMMCIRGMYRDRLALKAHREDIRLLKWILDSNKDVASAYVLASAFRLNEETFPVPNGIPDGGPPALSIKDLPSLLKAARSAQSEATELEEKAVSAIGTDEHVTVSPPSPEPGQKHAV